ncbi:conjugative transfer protein TrbG, partial [Mesorhizobium sp. LSJC255A00]
MPAFRKMAFPALLLCTTVLGGCATKQKPPEISYDDPVPAVQAVDPPPPVKVVELSKPLPLPGQLKPVGKDARLEPEPTDPTARVNLANAAARVQPVRNGFINSMQVYPFVDGALYQVYASPGQITDIALQPGEQLVGSGPVAAGDTVRWIIGDTESGTGQPGEQLVGSGPVAAGDTVRWIIGDTESGTGGSKQVHILVKPTRADLTTNLVINTDRRTYHMELRSTPSTYMASVSWQYAQDQLIALRRQNQQAEAAQPVSTGIDLSRVNFRYEVTGDRAPWRPLRAFDDGKQAFIEFPRGIGQGEMPPLFVVGPEGDTSELVNYRVRGNYMIVDRLFAAAELRFGAGKKQQRVRISRSDGVRSSRFSWMRGPGETPQATSLRTNRG